jgi:hypothetical protein
VVTLSAKRASSAAKNAFGSGTNTIISLSSATTADLNLATAAGNLDEIHADADSQCYTRTSTRT